MEKKLLLGDEAIALGAIHAGIRGVYAYPGTPSTEITEYIQRHPLARARGLHSTWCTNEKTAVEAALGASYAGARVIACMKHVGLNGGRCFCQRCHYGRERRHDRGCGGRPFHALFAE